MLKVTFEYFSKILNKTLVNVESHKSIENAKLRAMALNWTIVKIEGVKP